MPTPVLVDFLEKAQTFQRNLSKDPEERRSDPSKTESKCKKLNILKSEFETFKASDKYNLKDIDNTYVSRIENILADCAKILKLRLAFVNVNVNLAMEKFDLKTASSLLPLMNGTESVTRQLIEGIDLYNALLDEQGKKALTTYVLKTRLTLSAKLKLKTSYDNNENLIKDLKVHCITKQSASALASKLHSIRQGSNSISDFGKVIEDLMVNLTLSQTDNDENAIKILNKVNEKIAINSFANGLNNHELRTIMKARGYTTLSEVIRGAQDEDMNKTAQVFHMKSKFRNTGNQQNYRYNKEHNGRKPHNGRYQNRKYEQVNPRMHTSQFRGGKAQINKPHRTYTASSNQNLDNNNPTQQFFRIQRS